jgi:hypothetical protein
VLLTLVLFLMMMIVVPLVVVPVVPVVDVVCPPCDPSEVVMGMPEISPFRIGAPKAADLLKIMLARIAFVAAKD